MSIAYGSLCTGYDGIGMDGDDRGQGGPEYWSKRGKWRINGAPLGAVVNLLPTPMAERSGNNRGGAAGREGQPVRPSLDSVHALLPEVWGKYAEAVALWESITGVPAPDPTEAAPRGGRRLSPLLPEWMMGLRTGLLTDRLRRSDALKAGGNGAVPAAVAAAYQLLSAG